MATVYVDKGRLVLQFSRKDVRCREYRGLDNTTGRNARATTMREIMEAEIEAGTFDYAKRFPESKKVQPT